MLGLVRKWLMFTEGTECVICSFAASFKKQKVDGMSEVCESLVYFSGLRAGR